MSKPQKRLFQLHKDTAQKIIELAEDQIRTLRRAMVEKCGSEQIDSADAAKLTELSSVIHEMKKQL